MFKCLKCGERADFHIQEDIFITKITRINKNRSISKRTSRVEDELADLGRYSYALACNSCGELYSLWAGHGAETIDDFKWHALGEEDKFYGGLLITDKQYDSLTSEDKEAFGFKKII